MSQGRYITVSTPSTVFRGLPADGQETEIGLSMWAAYRHPVGDRPGSDILLATEGRRELRPCGGVFPASAHLCVGVVTSVTPWAGFTSGHIVVVDCGVPVEVHRERAPGVQMGGSIGWPPAVGEWLALLGDLSAQPFGPVGGTPTIRCSPVARQIIDLDPLSGTFGQLLPLSVGARLPHDPDVVGWPTLFVTFRMVE